MSKNGKLNRIWLEVEDVQLDLENGAQCKVRLKADKAHPEPLWWSVAPETLGADKAPLDTYKEILRESDKKRVVLAGLTWDKKAAALHCDALRFQSAELGSR